MEKNSEKDLVDFFVYNISSTVGYLMSKPPSQKNSNDTI